MRLRLAALFFVGYVLLPACTRGRGPQIQLNSPSAPSPSFGDAPRMDPTARGTGGPGGGGTYEGSGGEGSTQGSTGTAVGVVAGAVAGGTALALTAAEGKITCVPGNDTPSDAGVTNLCSGERREASPDVERAFAPH